MHAPMHSLRLFPSSFGSTAGAVPPSETPPGSPRRRSTGVLLIEIVSWLAGPVILAATLLQP